MSTYRLHKALLISGGTVLGALLCGMSLANFVQGDSFSFYKQRASYEPKMWTSSAAASDWAYPARAEYPEAYAPQPGAQSLYLAEASQPVPEDRELYRSYGYQTISSEAPPDLPAERVQEPVVQVSRGSWTRPVAVEPPQSAPEDKPEQPEVAAESEAPAAPSVPPPAPAHQDQVQPPTT